MSAGIAKRDPATTSQIMSAVRSRDTHPELLLRKALHKRGLRYRVAPRHLVGKPDIVFITARIAVFVDGDFWHGNAWRLRHATSNEHLVARWRNSEFWRNKIVGNVARDARVTRDLESGLGGDTSGKCKSLRTSRLVRIACIMHCEHEPLDSVKCAPPPFLSQETPLARGGAKVHRDRPARRHGPHRRICLVAASTRLGVRDGGCPR